MRLSGGGFAFIVRAMSDRQYRDLPFHPQERPHAYGENVHLLAHAVLLTQVARIGQPECVQPELNQRMKEVYRGLATYLANAVLAKEEAKIPTRMKANHAEGIYEGTVVSPTNRIVLVSLARAGILPAFELFDFFTSILSPEQVRVDHVFINRSTDSENRVTGAAIQGSKIGGSIDDAYVIIPDPMGATGSSLCQVVDYYKEQVKGKPKAWISLNLMITPEYLEGVKSKHAEVSVYTVRLDRALSSTKALKDIPGKFPKEERGLNEEQYILPGAGGIGEVTSNSWE